MLSSRLPASRHTANASGRSSSSAAFRSSRAYFTVLSSTGTWASASASASTTGLRRSLNSTVFCRRPSSESALVSGSRALIWATTGSIRFTSRSCLDPKIAASTLSIIDLRNPLRRHVTAFAGPNQGSYPNANGKNFPDATGKSIRGAEPVPGGWCLVPGRDKSTSKASFYQAPATRHQPLLQRIQRGVRDDRLVSQKEDEEEVADSDR